MATTQTSRTPNNLSVFYPDVLKRIWKEENRPEVYSREQQFSYFWDNRDVVDQKK